MLGNVNVTLLSNQAKYDFDRSYKITKSRFRFFPLPSCSSFFYIPRFAYKDEYEKFKLYMTIILMFGAITCLFFLNYRWETSSFLFCWCLKMYFLHSFFLFRVTDEIFNFLLVWYYCTLTIRESILMNNGSRYLFYYMICNSFSIHAVILAERRCICSCSHVFYKDQRVVGVSPLRLHLSVGGNANLVSFVVAGQF